LARARRKAADTATKTSPEKAREEAGAPRAPLEQNAEKKRKPRASQKGDRKRVRVSEGVYRDRYGLAATVKVNGIQREKRYPRDTGLRTIQAWRAETRGSLVTLPKAAKHTLEHDAPRYLHQIKSELVSIPQRRHNVGLWVAKFGHIRTLVLERHIGELNEQLHGWRKERAAATCNHRRDALMNLVRVLYGKKAASGLSDLVTFQKPRAKPRWRTISDVSEVLAHLEPGTKVRARLLLLQWTGMRPSQEGRLTPTDFHLEEEIPYVMVGYGKKGDIAEVPLMNEGLAAAREFIALNAFGKWRTDTANRALAKAAAAAGVPRFTTYQIRHSFAMGLLESGTDVADIQDMYGHTNPRTTRIYAKASLEKKKKSIKNLQRADEIAAMKLASKERGSG
jgi:integrase